MSTIWHGTPGFPATHLDAHVTRYRVSDKGAVAIAADLDAAAAALMGDQGASLTAVESFRAEADIVLPQEMFVMEVDGQGAVNLDARHAALAEFVKQRQEAEREAWRERARHELRAAEIPAEGELIVDWNEPGLPTLARCLEVLGLDLPGLRASALREVNAAFERAIGRLTAGYPESEKLSWPDQKAEALAWGASKAAPTPYVDGLAAARGIPRERYLAKTLAKVQAFQGASALAIGTRQGGEDAVKLAVDAAAIEAAGTAAAAALDALFDEQKSTS